MGRKDQISSLFWFCIALGVIQQGLKLGVGSFRKIGVGGFPLICGIALACLSLGILIKSTLGARGKGEKDSLRVNWVSFGRIGTITAALLVYIFAFPRFGFFFCTFWFLYFLFRNPAQKGWWSPFLSAALTTLASFLLFHIMLQIEFPIGPWRLK